MKENKLPFLYIVNIRLPTNKAHGVQIMNTCKELNKICLSENRAFELIICDRDNPTAGEMFDYYNISENDKFKITKIKTITLFRPFIIGYFMQKLQFILKLQIYLLFKYRYNAIIYSRDEFILFTLIAKVKYKFWETHEGKYNIIVKILFKFLIGLVTISGGLNNFYKNKFSKNILIAHDAVDLDKFNININKDEIKEKLNLSQDKKIVTYIGSVGLYGWKGLDIFLDSSEILIDICFLIVGGDDKDINNLKNKYKNTNIIFLGRKLPKDIPELQAISDLLILPNKSGNIISEKYTSPMKLFEYMASDVPILSSDLPSLREILDEENAYFFEANSSQDMSSQIVNILNDENRFTKAKKARKDVENFTYKKRAEKIYKFIFSNI